MTIEEHAAPSVGRLRDWAKGENRHISIAITDGRSKPDSDDEEDIYCQGQFASLGVLNSSGKSSIRVRDDNPFTSQVTMLIVSMGVSFGR